jgi:hypothetical protein
MRGRIACRHRDDFQKFIGIDWKAETGARRACEPDRLSKVTNAATRRSLQ